MRYLFAEVSHGYLLEEDEQLYSEKQRRVSTFMKTPQELEQVRSLVRHSPGPVDTARGRLEPKRRALADLEHAPCPN